jgi:uncharacterized membrane protein YidH (DUF202 family)
MIFQFIPTAEASIQTLVKSINRVIINPLIIFIFALAVLYFVYGLVKYLLSPDNEQVKKDSRQHMLWGVIGMFIMIATFGIMNLILNTLQVSKEDIQIEETGDYKIGNMLD